MRALFTSIALLATLNPAPPQQARVIDDGSFTIYVNGVRAGREQFQIRQTPVADGITVVAQGTIVLGERKLSPALTADTTGQIAVYSLEIRRGNHVEALIRADASAGRFVQRAQDDSGHRSETARRLVPGMVVLDDDVVHHYYFVALQRGAARIPVWVPRRAALETVTISVRETGPVQIRNGTVAASHLIVTDAAGVATDLWVDAASRVLRVATPARGYIAERDEAPR